MAGNSNGPASAAPSPFDHVFIQTLMSRLQLRPPYLDTNSFLSHSLDDFLLQDHLAAADPSDDDGSDDDAAGGGGDISAISEPAPRHRRRLAKEEAKLEKEIIRIINSGGALETLKANSGQSVAIGDHNICVGSHEDRTSEYRVWEWHGHIMFFEDEDGLSTEYIYGNYFERLPVMNRNAGIKEEEEEEEELEEEEDTDDEETKVKSGCESSGLLDLIAGPDDQAGRIGGRVLHRNSLNNGSSSKVAR